MRRRHHGPDDCSIQAISRVLAQRGTSLTKAYGLFAAANRAPAVWYAEGAANRYPVAGPAATFKLTSGKKDGGWKRATLKHLSNVTARFTPGSGLSASSWKLTLAFDMSDRVTAPAAVVTVYKTSGLPQVSMVALTASGAGTRKVAFGSRSVKYVEVTLANASARYTSCWTGGAYSCQGSSLDDGRKVLVRATATR